MKVTIKGWIHWRKFGHMKEADYCWIDTNITESPELIPVFEHSFEVEIPDDYDPTPEKIRLLRAEKQRIQAEAHVKAENIEAQIQELLCIENKGDTK